MQGPAARPTQQTGASRLLRALCPHARICFANPGTTEMHLVAALDELQGTEQGIRAVLCLHETVATGAADGYARMARQPACVLLHLGPGLANGIANLHNARRARSPVLCIIGDMATWHLSADPLLAMDITALARTVSHTVADAAGCTQPSNDGKPSNTVANAAGYIQPSNSSKASTTTSPVGQGLPSSSASGSFSGDWASEVHTLLGGLYGAGSTGVVSALAPNSTDSIAGSTVVLGLVCKESDSLVASCGNSNSSTWRITSGPSDSRVVTLIVPHDLSWEIQDQTQSAPPISAACTLPSKSVSHPTCSIVQAVPAPAGGAVQAATGPTGSVQTNTNEVSRRPTGSVLTYTNEASAGARVVAQLGASGSVQLSSATLEFISLCAVALKEVPKGTAALYLGGEALLSVDGALQAAGLVAAATGSALLCENAFARVDRGAGLPRLQRLPYFPQEAARLLSRFKMLVVVDARLPVANFGYQDGPSQLVPASLISSDAVWELDAGGGPPGTVAACLRALADAVGATQSVQPGINCGGLFVTTAKQPTVPDADESLTSGGPYWDLSQACHQFTHLTLTGGAIGSGPPLALGAAMAVGPNRCVINLQADGSAMYALQALWSQARQGVCVITIICSNNAYNILKVECARQRIAAMGPATRSLTDLSSPPINWVDIAHGMGVPAVAACTAGELCAALRRAIDTAGPSLIQAML